MTISIASSNSASSNTTQLRVIEVEDLTSIQQVTKEWMELAKKRFRKADVNQYSATPVCDDKTLDRLEASMSITKAIFNRINSIITNDGALYITPWNKALVCMDQDSKVQALALIDDDKNIIVDLATHPDNIPTLLVKKEKQVRGAGTEIILHLAKNALKTGRDIQLDYITGSEPFYEKLGFKEFEFGKYTLTTRKIKALISHKIPPFDKLQIEEE